MKCFYDEKDLDGKCSAAIVKYKYPECELIGVSYLDDIESKIDELVSIDEEIFVVDFCFSQKTMEYIWENSKKFVWIDHHISAIKLSRNFLCDPLEGYRRTDLAACELTWNYLFPNIKMPKIVYFLGRYDVWAHNEDPKIVPFQKGFEISNLNINNNEWNIFLNEKDHSGFIHNEIINFINIGKNVIKIERFQNNRLCKEYSFETKLNNYKAIVVNSLPISNFTFETVWKEDKYDLMIGFIKKDKKWKVSLRTTKENIDVSEIAIKYGGGGHKKSAGFVCKKLPF